jgi:hypothetical protein
MMSQHERDSVLSHDLSARDDFAVAPDVAFLNAAHIGPRRASVRAAVAVALDLGRHPGAHGG